LLYFYIFSNEGCSTMWYKEFTQLTYFSRNAIHFSVRS